MELKTVYGRYEISSNGEVYSLPNATRKTRRMMNPSVAPNGYKIIGFFINGKRVYKSVHRLVAECFIGIPKGYEVNHIDGDKLNNSLENLEVCTPSENQRHAFRTGLQKRKGGVSYHKRDKTWRAYLEVDGVTKTKQGFATKEDAMNYRKQLEKDMLC